MATAAGSWSPARALSCTLCPPPLHRSPCGIPVRPPDPILSPIAVALKGVGHRRHPLLSAPQSIIQIACKARRLHLRPCVRVWPPESTVPWWILSHRRRHLSPFPVSPAFEYFTVELACPSRSPFLPGAARLDADHRGAPERSHRETPPPHWTGASPSHCPAPSVSSRPLLLSWRVGHSTLVLLPLTVRHRWACRVRVNPAWWPRRAMHPGHAPTARFSRWAGPAGQGYGPNAVHALL
jgi:hypothetical protein